MVCIPLVIPILVSTSLKLQLVLYLSLLFNISFNDFVLPLFNFTLIKVNSLLYLVTPQLMSLNLFTIYKK